MKVSKTYQEHRKTCNGKVYHTTYEAVPAIRISGHWLTEIGFNIGDNFTVIITNNSLTLRKEN